MNENIALYWTGAWKIVGLHDPCQHKLQVKIGRKAERSSCIHSAFFTPVSETECIDIWMHLRNIQIDDDEISREMDKIFLLAFD